MSIDTLRLQSQDAGPYQVPVVSLQHPGSLGTNQNRTQDKLLDAQRYIVAGTSRKYVLRTTTYRHQALRGHKRNLLDYSARKICCTSKLDRTDYAITPGLGAYKIHKRSVTWNEARKICVKEGAQLAVLDSARKLNLLRAWMNKESLETLWLGFHDIFEEGSWTTVTGELVDTIGYHPWATGEPNNWYNGMQVPLSK
ncbi:C-type lectin domain family 4 member M-like [Augochlora pura]